MSIIVRKARQFSRIEFVLSNFACSLQCDLTSKKKGFYLTCTANCRGFVAFHVITDCSYDIAFPRQNDWTSKRHYKALDVTVSLCSISSVSIFKEIDCKVTAFLDCLALVESYQERFKQLTQLSAQ